MKLVNSLEEFDELVKIHPMVQFGWTEVLITDLPKDLTNKTLRELRDKSVGDNPAMLGSRMFIVPNTQLARRNFQRAAPSYRFAQIGTWADCVKHHIMKPSVGDF